MFKCYPINTTVIGTILSGRACSKQCGKSSSKSFGNRVGPSAVTIHCSYGQGCPSRCVSMDTLEPYFGIKYKLTKNTNWEEFLEAMGIDISQIKGGTRISPTVELSRYQDKITLKTVSVFKNYAVTFKLGEEYEDELPDGQKVKCVMHLEDNKLLQTIPHHTDMLEIVREFGFQEMHATYTFGDFVATRKYKKQ